MSNINTLYKKKLLIVDSTNLGLNIKVVVETAKTASKRLRSPTLVKLTYQKRHLLTISVSKNTWGKRDI